MKRFPPAISKFGVGLAIIPALFFVAPASARAAAVDKIAAHGASNGALAQSMASGTCALAAFNGLQEQSNAERRSANRQSGRTSRQGTRSGDRTTRQDNRTDTRADGTEARTDTRSDRSGERTERVDDRTDVRSDRTDVRGDAVDNWDDYYGRYRYGYRVTALPVGYTRVVVGTAPYYYHGGVYYNYVGGSYVVVAAPVGARIAVLPAGYRTVVVGGVPLYYVNSTYYRYDEETKTYIVVTKP